MREIIFILIAQLDSHQVCTDLGELLIDVRRNAHR